MALEKAEIHPSSSWFLIARGGDVRLRLQREICIGEDETGDLVLNPEPADSLVECSVSFGELTLRVTRDDAILSSKDGTRNTQLQIDSGQTVTLLLPHNTLRLTGEAGPERNKSNRIRVLTGIVAEPLQAPRRPSLNPVPATTSPTDDSQVDSRIPTLEHQLPETFQVLPLKPEPTSDLLEPILVTEVLAGPDPESSAKPEAELLLEPVRSSGGSALGLILLCLLVPAIATSDRVWNPPSTAAPAAPSTIVIPPAAKKLVLLSSSAAVLSEEEAVQSEAAAAAEKPATLDDGTDQSADSEAAAATAAAVDIDVDTQAVPAAQEVVPAGAPPVDEALQKSLIARLQEAETYLDSGDIISPAGANAVIVLKRILAVDPTNAQALKLMYQCASALLAQADEAQAAGDTFLARNLVEEVLAFHPTHPDANQRWDQLTAADSQ
jgi:hypothetical protein